ncbi:MAG TPA: (4Fe-4S)-binding protein [Gemmatimonadales bacterium]|nr:(4Fe-4S)-binding protein [Gemmatimonadales bacterium]
MTKRLQTYQASGISVTYDPSICMHAAECVRTLPAVFDPREKRWIRPERATPDEVERAVARCPTGALRAIRHGPIPPVTADKARPADAAVVIRLLHHGPLRVSGPIRIETEAGDMVFDGAKATLCRCGGTGNPPFCDGSHAGRKFRPAR